jgi:putative alpha-1,2-mannosidase
LDDFFSELNAGPDRPHAWMGNEPSATTLAWYVLSALGLFPAVPGIGGLAVGSPMFSDTVVQLANGGVLHIVAPSAAADAPYVQSLTIDGSPLQTWWIDWDRLARGATLEFTLSQAPAT